MAINSKSTLVNHRILIIDRLCSVIKVEIEIMELIMKAVMLVPIHSPKDP